MFTGLTGSFIFTGENVLASEWSLINVPNSGMGAMGGVLQLSFQGVAVDLTLASESVPEPGTIAAFGAGLAALLGFRRRRRRFEKRL